MSNSTLTRRTTRLDFVDETCDRETEPGEFTMTDCDHSRESTYE